ncbi:metal ABC transporter solute-binding protein, Zn/Mn family [Pontibacillus sp. HMF3514]|uniref:metal ABC transporter solute-binding protein, Zn/Mn family n=1 Tax=Pontibacillus sp. HMF3514 TaxID=2692425 RepID=UPI00131FE154|nr:zinc ABC transporter substrate-binding protein [Pontibacillus sp. HMF3514]QHE51166.1 zinc ABC transporter solute-binding protein [Pontibacillus sp. HMF3514]
MKKLLFMLVFPALLLAGCNNAASSGDQNGDGKVKVVTTIAQIADVARNVGGENVEVESLMGPGTDPHLYKATHSDIESLQEADIIFYNGHHLEGQMNKVFKKMRKQKPTYAVAESIPEEKMDADPENPEIYDPHVWFDVTMWQYTVDEVAKGLSDLDPDNKEAYEKNAKDYNQKLDELHKYAKEQINKIPEESRVLVTAHDAFHYFGKAYGMEVRGLQGLSTESEFGLKDVQRIVNLLSERNIKAVFVESSVSERSINAVVEGAKENGHNVKIGGELYSDAMGPEDTKEGTYIGMFKHNVETIVNALK